MITPLQSNPSFASIIRHNVISCLQAWITKPHCSLLTHRDYPHVEAGTEAGAEAGHWRSVGTRRPLTLAMISRGHVCSVWLSSTDWGVWHWLAGSQGRPSPHASYSVQSWAGVRPWMKICVRRWPGPGREQHGSVLGPVTGHTRVTVIRADHGAWAAPTPGQGTDTQILRTESQSQLQKWSWTWRWCLHDGCRHVSWVTRATCGVRIVTCRR